MAAFEYLVLDAQGRQQKGTLEADSPRQARQLLREKQLTPLQVTQAKARESHSNPLSFGQGLSASDLALITRQLATLVQAALPIEEALRAAAAQTRTPKIKSMLLAVRARVLEGHSLAASLKEYPGAFPDLYRATVAAGEHAGHLALVLEQLADYTEQRQQSRQKIQLALLYPLILMVAALTIVGFLLGYVVPDVVKVFVNTGQQLPALTRGLIALSEFLRQNGWLLLLVLGTGAGAWVLALRRSGFRRRVHRALLRLPLVARLVRGTNTARFARTFSILMASGVPVLEALRISTQVVSNLPMREAVEQAAARVKEGASLHKAISASGYFPPMTVQLIASGEASGRLENMLERAAIQQERETETLIAALLGIFEPVLILVMGGVVLIIVLAILLPIFDLNQLVR